jgi:hypothetical protein
MGYNPTSFPNDPLLSQESFRLGCYIQPHFAQPIHDDARCSFVGVREAKGGRQKQATGRGEETTEGTLQRLLILHVSKPPIRSHFPYLPSAGGPPAFRAGVEFMKPPVGSIPHSARRVFGAYYHVVKNTPASTRLPTTDANETRIAIERLESQAQTHDCRRDGNEKERPVVPAGNRTRRMT